VPRTQYRSVSFFSSKFAGLYFNRRDFLRTAGILSGSALLAACAPSVSGATATDVPQAAAAFAGKTDELGSPLNTFDDITHYNNYYEFSTSKEAVAPLSVNFQSHPWKVVVSGLVNKPGTFAIEDHEALPRRLHLSCCVEAWAW
jgi:sulfoxide reductase catalytic subunit YedY